MSELTRLERVLNLVISVIVADGEVRPEERELFELMVENLGLEERVVHRYRVMFEVPGAIDVGELVRAAAAGAAPDEVAELVREAYLVAAADGDIEARERDVVDRFLEAVGVGSERFEAIHAWGRTAVEHAGIGRSLFVLQAASCCG